MTVIWSNKTYTVLSIFYVTVMIIFWILFAIATHNDKPELSFLFLMGGIMMLISLGAFLGLLSDRCESKR